MRVKNPAASRLDESSGKALNADHDNQAKLRDLTVSTHFSFEIMRDRRLRNLTVSTHFSFEIVRDRRLRNLTVSTHFPFEIVRDRRLKG